MRSGKNTGHDIPQYRRLFQTLEYQGREYFRQNGGEWKPYGG